MSKGSNAFSIAVTGMTMLGDWFQASESNKLNKEQLALQRKAYKADMLNSWGDAGETLDMLLADIGAGQSQISGQISQLSSYDEALGRWGDYYNLAMAEYDNNIATLQENRQSDLTQLDSNITGLQNWLGGYNDRYALAMNSMFQSNIGTLRQMQEGLAQQQVISATRGQSGSTAKLLSQMQRQEIVNMAGTDMTLDADGGYYGQQYRQQKYDMEEEKRQTQEKLDTTKTEKANTEARYGREIALAEGQKREGDLDLKAQKREWEGNKKLLQEAIGINTETLNRMKGSVYDIVKSSLALGYDAKVDYSELERFVDKYQNYLTSDGKDYETIKADLLKQYSPLDYRVATYTYETESGGEGENGANIREHTGYQVYVKNKDTDLWEQATGKQMKELKKLYGKSYAKDYIAANSDNYINLDLGGLDLTQDAAQKKLEKAGSRRK